MRRRIRILRKWCEKHVPLPPCGIAIGAALFLAVHAVSPHPGESCGNLGRTAEEWEIGMPATPLLCAATLDGDLRYQRMIVPPKRHREARAL